MKGARAHEVLASVRVPTLILDVARAESNLEHMLVRAKGWGVRFRPHFKTHQSADVARLFRDRDVTACTVSSVRMGSYFAKHGWDNLTIAVPVNRREMAELRALSSLARISVLVDSSAAVVPLAAGELPGASVWIEIDCGYARTGVRWDDADALAGLARAVDSADGVTLVGILTHAGRSYATSGAGEVLQVHEETLVRMAHARSVIVSARPAGAPLEVSVGDTPSASLAERMDGVDEIRPGNFIFFDLMQLDLGSCAENDLAVAVACPVIGCYPERGEIVVYGGAIHLAAASRSGSSARSGASARSGSSFQTGSSPRLADPVGEVTCGCLVEPAESGLGRLRLDAPLVRLSQEHGVIRMPGDLMERVAVGDVALISPVHSCLTCAVHDHYLTLDGRRFGKM